MHNHLTAVPDYTCITAIIPKPLQISLLKNRRQVCYCQSILKQRKRTSKVHSVLVRSRRPVQETPLHTNERRWHSWEPSISWRRGHHSRWRHTIGWRWHYSRVDWLDCRSWGWDGCRRHAISGGNAKGGWHCQRFLAHATLALQVTHAGLHAFSLAAGLVQITTLCTWYS